MFPKSPLNPIRHRSNASVSSDNNTIKAATKEQQQVPPPTQAAAAATSSASTSPSEHFTAQGVIAGRIGSGYGPYSYQPVSPDTGSFARPSSDSHAFPPSPGFSDSKSFLGSYTTNPSASTISFEQLLKDEPEDDDYLHNPTPREKREKRRLTDVLTLRGWLNISVLVIIAGGLIILFAGYPIVSYVLEATASNRGAWNLGGINSTGQVPEIVNFRGLVDKATPTDALTRVGFDGHKYNLVFSDEFEQDGRTFWPGDDPFWEAVDLHYYGTGDYEWYDPDTVTTKDGKLRITITEEPIHDLHFRSGMIQSWNKFCFTGGYVEVSVSFPGSYNIPGFWPGAWTMGNLARAGYGATNDGVWPYSYDSCDVGVLRNQTNRDGRTPAAATTSGSQAYGGALSYQPGQRLSACTCANAGDQHPGPSPNKGRGGPEIDILEAQITDRGNGMGRVGSVSQSAQFAPYDDGYNYVQAEPASKIYNAAQTYFNDYKGSVYQEAASAVTYVTNHTVYGGVDYERYGYEYWPDRTNGYITWSQGGQPTWTLTSATVGPNANTQIGQRMISEEPMYVMLNLALSGAFQEIDWANLVLPNTMYVDYVRVYQREGSENVGCDPPTHPTMKYIQNHKEAYINPNLTTWAQAGYSFPKNSMQDGC